MLLLSSASATEKVFKPLVGATFTHTGLVLKSTKLGETDVILTMLVEDGSLVQGVLKGARNPKSKTVGKAEIFSLQKILCAQGRSLSIITDSIIIESSKCILDNYEASLTSSVIAEIALKTSISDNPQPRFFDLTNAALQALTKQKSPLIMYAVMVAYFLKALALQGYRPALQVCASCFEEKDAIGWSDEMGGLICSNCFDESTCTPVSTPTASWMRFFMMSTFDEIVASEYERPVLDETSRLLKNFFEYNIGTSLKSLAIFWSLSA